MLVKLDHFPNFRDENKKYLSCHHLVFVGRPAPLPHIQPLPHLRLHDLRLGTSGNFGSEILAAGEKAVHLSGAPPATRPCFSPRKTHTKKNWKTGVATLISINLKPLKAATVAFKKWYFPMFSRNGVFSKGVFFQHLPKEILGSTKKCSPFLQPALYTPQRKNGKQKQQNTGVFEIISQWSHRLRCANNNYSHRSQHFKQKKWRNQTKIPCNA